MIGAAAGDAVGAPMEFWDVERYDRVYGSDWVDDMFDFHEMGTGPHGLWRPDPPKGTFTGGACLNHRGM